MIFLLASNVVSGCCIGNGAAVLFEKPQRTNWLKIDFEIPYTKENGRIKNYKSSYEWMFRENWMNGNGISNHILNAIMFLLHDAINVSSSGWNASHIIYEIGKSDLFHGMNYVFSSVNIVSRVMR